ncbi:hypothetical protein DRO32_00760 [Candidatus Bathyarchaeota archaeon]|mgnify:CR=1 FL=1|nr:MAG: hypothetical protein DRO32_00760 [Candidatus Bathyarchaeota archaeon]
MREEARKLVLDGREFLVKLPGPAVMPFLQLYRRLVADGPSDLEEARRRSEQIPGVVEEILRACVEGPIEDLGPGGQLILLSTIGDMLAEALRPEKLDLFRQERGG